MSLSTLKKVLADAKGDAALRQALRDDPVNALAAYDDLEQEERDALLVILPDYLGALPKAGSPWRRMIPGSFKELGAAVVSVVLVGLMIYSIVEVLAAVSAPIEIAIVNDTEQVVDVFGRASELLNTLFPLFAAVITFWLGVSVESKRADDQAAEKEDAKGDAQDARGEKERIARNAEAAFARIEGAARGGQGAPPGDLQGGEGQVNRALILDLVQQGRDSLR